MITSIQCQAFNELQRHEYLITASALGNINIKPEDNAPTLAELAAQNGEPHVTEIVTSPIRFDQIPKLQTVLTDLESAGGEGTQPNEAVALQVNVEIGKGDREKIKTASVLRVLRNYLRRDHLSAIENRLQVPEIRRRYVGRPARVLGTNYESPLRSELGRPLL